MPLNSTPDTIPTKQCSRCREWKPATVEYFEPSKGCNDGIRSQCKVCRNSYKKVRADRRSENRHSVDEPATLRQCYQCKGYFPATTEHFQRDKYREDGLRCICKTCAKVRKRARREHESEYARAYYAANKERRLANARAWMATNKERWREYNRAYHAANKERRMQVRKKWLATRPEYLITYSRAYRAANPERFVALAQRRRARELAAEGTHTAQDIKAQYKRQKGRCHWCNTKVGNKYHVDHVVPLSRGGSNWPENIVIACPTCNVSKSNKMPHEWIQGGRLL